MKTKTSWFVLALPTLVAALTIGVFLNWHLPTRVKIVLTTDRVVFKIAGDDKYGVLDSVGFTSITLENFESVKLTPESLKTFDSGRESGSANLSSRNGSTAIAIAARPVVISGKQERTNANVTLATIDQGALLAIDSINVRRAAEVTLVSTPDPGDVTLRVDGQHSSGKITVVGPITIAFAHCDVAGITSNLNLDEPVTLQTKLVRDSSIEFTGQPKSLILTVSVPTEKTSRLFPQERIPVSDINFERLEDNGKVVSTLVKDTCEISYPDYQDKFVKEVVSSPDFLVLDHLQNFSIEEMTYDAKKPGISMTMQGVVDKVTSGSPDYPKDLRLTIYDALWNNHKVVALFAVLCWVAGTTAAFQKLFKEKAA